MRNRASQTILSYGLLFAGSLLASPAAALTVESGSFREDIPRETLSSFSFIETVLVPKSDTRSEIENTSFCETPLLCLWTMSRQSRETTAVHATFRVDSERVRTYVDSIASRADRDPKNAVFGENAERQLVVVEPSEEGIRLDAEASTAAILSAIENGQGTALLPSEKTAPGVASSDMEKIGLRELVAEGVTDFRGSPKNRIHNIKRAIKQYHGLLLAPRQEFSFVEYLGEVDGAHGYLPELVIKYNKTEPEFGGGICQVSSTVFRAAINAGFKITARKNHAYPVSYYKPYGMDATIYIPNPDLRFVNNTPNHILIQADIEGTKLSFRFYGTKDGRTVTVDGPHILESNPDGSMKTTFSQKVTDASGSTIINDAFPSSYKSPALFPHFEILNEKPKEWTKKQWEEYLVEKSAYQAKLSAAYATVVREEPQD